MSRFFNEDNIVWSTISKVADLMTLNIVFILCCLPIVTIGASLTALYSVSLKMIKNEDGYFLKNYFQAFKNNFKQSTIIWMILLVVGVLIVGEWYFMSTIQSTFAAIFNYLFVFIGFIYLIVLSYVFPIQSKYENKIGVTILNSVLMGIAYFIPWTLVIVFVNVLPLLLLMIDVHALAFVLPVMTIVGFSLLACINGYMFQKIFSKFE